MFSNDAHLVINTTAVNKFAQIHPPLSGTEKVRKKEAYHYNILLFQNTREIPIIPTVNLWLQVAVSHKVSTSPSPRSIFSKYVIQLSNQLATP